MSASKLTAGLAGILLAGSAFGGPGVTPPAGAPAERKTEIMVEGVASSGQASPVSVLREIEERVRGRVFSIMYGQYVSFLDNPAGSGLITDRTRLVGIEKLRTGLFKATMLVKVAPDIEARLERLRERTQRGEGDLRREGSLILARAAAREDALEKGILAAVAEQYPGESAPARLAGRVYFLGTIRENLEEGKYVILSRLKVELFQP